MRSLVDYMFDGMGDFDTSLIVGEQLRTTILAASVIMGSLCQSILRR